MLASSQSMAVCLERIRIQQPEKTWNAPRSLSSVQHAPRLSKSFHPKLAHQMRDACNLVDFRCKHRGHARAYLRRSGARCEGEAMGNVTMIESEEDFKSALDAAGDKLVVLDVATKTCGPCKMVWPLFTEMSTEYDDVVFLKIYGDHSKETRTMMKDWKVTAVPLFNYYRNGVKISSVTGAKIEKIRAEVDKLLA